MKRIAVIFGMAVLLLAGTWEVRFAQRTEA